MPPDPSVLLAEIDRLKFQLDALRPLPEHTVRTLHEQQVLEWTYHSNAIEGNTLSLKETKVVLEGITIGGKSMREHFEAINHREAIDYVEALVSGKETSGNEALSEWHIKNVHQLVLKNIDDRNAGRYRQQNVVIAGASHTPTDFLHLPQAMSEFMAWYQNAKDLHPLMRAAQLHVDFVGIHPFVDGNGRTARLLMNCELLRCGYLPVILRVEQRLAYYDTLDTAHTTHNYAPFVQLVAEQEREALQHYLSVIRGGR